MQRLIPHLMPRLDDEQKSLLIELIDCLANALSHQAALDHSQLLEELIEHAVCRPKLKPSIQLLLAELHARGQRLQPIHESANSPKH